MGLYEFRTISQGKTIWTVEHYCQDDLDALQQAATSVNAFETTVWKHGHQIRADITTSGFHSEK